MPTVETNLLVLCREIIRIYCESHKKHVNTLCGQNVDFLHATAYGPYAGLCMVTVYHKRIKSIHLFKARDKLRALVNTIM
jgi:hypothetical protein